MPTDLTAAYIDPWNGAREARDQLRRSPYGYEAIGRHDEAQRLR